MSIIFTHVASDIPVSEIFYLPIPAKIKEWLQKIRCPIHLLIFSNRV
jgi:hypothetical protein